VKWIILLVAVVAIWRLLGWNLGRGSCRKDIAHYVTSLLVLLEDDGRLRICRRGSQQRLEMIRAAGNDAEATIRIEVPREEWSEPFAGEIRKIAEAQDLDVNFGRGEVDRVLCDTSVLVPDIWKEWAGARAARVANRILDGLGVPDDATLDFELIGPRSTRSLQRNLDDL
jgi:hypothetical protein